MLPMGGTKVGFSFGSKAGPSDSSQQHTAGVSGVLHVRRTTLLGKKILNKV